MSYSLAGSNSLPAHELYHKRAGRARCRKNSTLVDILIYTHQPSTTLLPHTLYPRADPEQCCWGGARTVGGVRARRREALAEGAAAGVWGAKIGLLES